MFSYSGKTALITGASSGIGEAFARNLAGRGMNLVLVARSEGKLRSLAEALVQRYAIRAEVIATDLSKAGAAQQIFTATQQRGLQVDLLINNAGFATHGAFETLDPTRDHEQVMLNVAALVDLTHAFVPGMVARGEGAVINVASTAAFQPLPYMAIYGATKAFVLSFSEALWAEYRGRGLRVLALCPGATATPFFDVVGSQEAQVGQLDTPERVVEVGLRALERQRSFVIPGVSNYLLSAALPRLLPRPAVALLARQFMRPREAQAPAAARS